MKITPAKVDGFVAAPDPSVAVILVYGPDLGLVAARFAALAAYFATDPSDPFQAARLDGGLLRREGDRFWDEVGALSLAGGRRLVMVRDAGDAVADLVAAYLADIAAAPVDAAVVLLDAGELAPRSKLRRVCEGDAHAAALPCYALEGRALRDFIAGRLVDQGVRVDRAAADYLAAALGSDHALRESELAKLVLYAGADAMLTVDDVAACIGDTSGAALSQLALAVAGGDLGGADRQTSKILADGVSPVAALRAVQGHFLRLYRAARRSAGGAGVDAAMAGLRPPVFWKDRDRFARQLGVWPLADLIAAMRRLGRAEIVLKSTGQPAAAVLRYELLAVAGQARRLTNKGRR